MTYFNLKLARTGSLWQFKPQLYNPSDPNPSAEVVFVLDSTMTAMVAEPNRYTLGGFGYEKITYLDFLLCLGETQKLGSWTYANFLHGKVKK